MELLGIGRGDVALVWLRGYARHGHTSLSGPCGPSVFYTTHPHVSFPLPAFVLQIAQPQSHVNLYQFGDQDGKLLARSSVGRHGDSLPRVTKIVLDDVCMRFNLLHIYAKLF